MTTPTEEEIAHQVMGSFDGLFFTEADRLDGISKIAAALYTHARRAREAALGEAAQIAMNGRLAPVDVALFEEGWIIRNHAAEVIVAGQIAKAILALIQEPEGR